jgi:TrmH family RNA methyltransferase
MRQKPQKTYHDAHTLTDRFILALVNLQKPGNIGALLRSADATGFRAIFLIDTALDIYNPNIIRSSTGACFLDNVYYLTSAAAQQFFKAKSYRVLAASPDGDQSVFNMRFEDKTAVVLGTEDQGLSDAWLENCDQRVRIPMEGQLADSLNVSVSGTIFMYEALRQQKGV